MAHTYHAPLEDIRFLLNDVLGIEKLLENELFKDFSIDVINVVLEEAEKFASEVLSPLNVLGDREGCTISNSVVKTPKGFKDAYNLFIQNGWNSVPFPQAIGGQGLPWVVSSAVSEMWSSANMAFALCPLLTQGMVGVLEVYGNKEQQTSYLPKLVSGEWTGTMCLTEPQAGSDVGAIATKATKQGDHYLLKGTKIFITYGEHDFTDNIVHLVLARIPGSPEGTKGISLFIVPKFLLDGTRNDVMCLSIEHKMGIHASPTAVLSFGEKQGAVGYLVGGECQGVEAMFTMMNHARLGVGIEGVAKSELALQQAESYASERVQGRGKTIDQHPDVKRMLSTIRANTEAMRALALYMTRFIDLDDIGDDTAKQRVDLLTPVIKAHGTDLGFEMASLAMQIFGGAGYIEETGIAQTLRDSRIAMIYEGTNGIQALDLVMRKLTMENGKLYHDFAKEMQSAIEEAKTIAAIRGLAEALEEAKLLLDNATATIREKTKADYTEGALVATPYLRLFGVVAGAYMMLLAAKATIGKEGSFYEQKYSTCAFYMSHILPEAQGLVKVVTA